MYACSIEHCTLSIELFRRDPLLYCVLYAGSLLRGLPGVHRGPMGQGLKRGQRTSSRRVQQRGWEKKGRRE